ncbi:MAG: MAPEG family protein [Propionivibrio sp.]
MRRIDVVFVMSNTSHLVAASLAMVLLVFAVGARLLYVRIQEMRLRRVHPQAIATSRQAATRLENIQAADNFRNLFEVPVLFYTLLAVAIGTNHAPSWLVVGAWSYVALRVVHSVIHCTYNKVTHRFAVFGSSFVLLVGLWVVFFFTLPGRGTA